ncbi:hypothetical protein HPP92_022591 [Vanilla planifolia]|uniref:Uncharacterized protein n=1 Tax=Vanilla planifolia TaxID=51239 RepID=A0A835PV14_VANPL|nr:hypothetical protein HPP92_022868 [Vanilla planifolia]KAG0459463.1 hypothetical protein HPP92_022591 [Vanilla planifolia]
MRRQQRARAQTSSNSPAAPTTPQAPGCRGGAFAAASTKHRGRELARTGEDTRGEGAPSTPKVRALVSNMEPAPSTISVPASSTSASTVAATPLAVPAELEHSPIEAFNEIS